MYKMDVKAMFASRNFYSKQTFNIISLLIGAILLFSLIIPVFNDVSPFAIGTPLVGVSNEAALREALDVTSKPSIITLTDDFPIWNQDDSSGVPYVVDGRILSADKAGDVSDWIEIARYDGYSLIVRKNYLNIVGLVADVYGQPLYQYTSYADPLSNDYLASGSLVRDYINKWFNNEATTQGSKVDNLSPDARLHDYTVQHNAINMLGTTANTESLTDGFSTPLPTQAGTGKDVAFALSYSEAAQFLSISHDIYGMNPEIQPSDSIAQVNFAKLAIPPSVTSPQLRDFSMWLRSPSQDSSNVAGSLLYNGRVFIAVQLFVNCMGSV
jgi:hypothetical protein